MTDRSYTNPRTGEVVETEPRPFDQILRELGEGSTLSELSETFFDVVQRVQETSKAGSVSLNLHVGMYALLLLVPWLLIAAFIAGLLVLVGVTGGAL